MENLWLAFGLTLFAGLATGIGSAISFVAKKTNTKFLAVALGFSAGVMIYISMTELFFQASETLIKALGHKQGSWMTVISFFTGMLFFAIVDKAIPSYENPHEVKFIEEKCSKECRDKYAKLYRTGIFVAIALAIHNFPEGISTFVAALQDPKLGLAIAIAIAIHNIPEGISVSVPIYYATGSRKKAFIYSFLSGLAEPLGAVIGYVFFIQFLGDVAFGFILAAVAGMMVLISIDELLPAAREYGEHHLSMYGLVAGMAVMALSLLMFV